MPYEERVGFVKIRVAGLEGGGGGQRDIVGQNETDHKKKQEREVNEVAIAGQEEESGTAVCFCAIFLWIWPTNTAT